VSAVEKDEHDGGAAIVYAVETTEQRALEAQFAQSQKMQAVGQLAGGIAHDFNNVLSAIMMATDFLLNAHRPTDPSFQDIMQIEVGDSGEGIPPEHIDKIFEPFFSTKEVGKGTGLGLSTVYGIVKQTGGFIFPESEVGRGTVFRIFLPRHIPRAEEAAAVEASKPVFAGEPTKAPADLTGHGTIMLVEDEEGRRALNARGLASRGYTVLEAGHGVEAMKV